MSVIPSVRVPAGPLGYASVFHTPRFSYETSETAVPTTSYTAPTDACGAVYGLGRVYGWVPGWVIRVGIPGSTPSHLESGGLTAKRAPEGPQGLEWVVSLQRAPELQYPPTPLRSGARFAGTGPLPGIPASGPIRTRFNLRYTKVSQNGRVSPKSVEKACHSPCSQNGSQMSPLQILRFPIWPAFSPKELMTLFDA